MKSILNLFNKINELIRKNFYILTAIVLFIIPFFWFSYGELDLGGDSSRLYFFDPLSWLKNIGLYSVNTLNSLNTENPQFYMVPFLFLLSLIKLVLKGSPYFLNCFFSGMLLSGSFVFTYLSLKEIINSESVRKKEICAVIGSLFFVFSPLVIDGWMKALYSFNQIFIYPLIFYLFLKYIKSQRIIYIFISLLASFIFAVNFSFATFPWFLAFFFFGFVFLFWYSHAMDKLRIFVKGTVFFLLLFLAVQAFQLIPQITNVLSVSNPNSRAVFSKELAVNRGLQYFSSLQPYTRLIYPLLNQVQFYLPKGIGAFDYGLKQWYLYYIYIFIVIGGGILIRRKGSLRERKTYTSGLILFLILAFLMSANVTRYLTSFYKSLFSIPGFSMYRSFYSKFGMTFTFFYAVLFSLSLSFLWDFLKFKIIKAVVALYLFSIIIFNGWPLISGMIVNSLLWQSENVKLPTEMNKKYLSYLDLVRKRKLDGRYLTLPLTNEEYQILQGERGGAYFGPSIISILGGKNDFAGFGSFNVFGSEIIQALSKKDFNILGKYFANLNIRYIFHNSDEYIYVNFPSYPYATVFKNTFPTQRSIANFISDFGYKPVDQIGYFSTYVRDEFYLPHIYIPKSVYITDQPIEILTKIYSQPTFQSRSVVYFTHQNFVDLGLLKEEGLLEKQNTDDYFLKKDFVFENEPVLEYKRINPAKYKVRIHGAKGKIHFVFLDIFDTKWKMYLSKIQDQWSSPSELLKKSERSNYSVSDVNQQDQASLSEIENFINNRWISDLGNIDFISKNFQGTIQNNNLPDGRLIETWFGSTKTFEIAKDAHLTANGYANSWVIDFAKICSKPKFCLKNNDGTYDIEIILEFWQQRLFYLGLAVSGSAVFATFLGILLYKKRNNDR